MEAIPIAAPHAERVPTYGLPTIDTKSATKQAAPGKSGAKSAGGAPSRVAGSDGASAAASPASASERRPADPSSARLTSLDAYRGFVMLAMVSGGLGFTSIVKNHPEVLQQYEGTALGNIWPHLWTTLAYQFEHVAWTGCSFWDLIQPSFMFMVGVAIPFSDRRRQQQGQSWLVRFLHVLWRSLILIALGVFLSSDWSSQTNFTFVNVLTQIGLGYSLVWVLLNRPKIVQWAALLAILGGYWFYFYQYEMPAAERENLLTYLHERNIRTGKPLENPGSRPPDWNQFEGFAAPWNKHVNAAAASDRKFLNLFPREEEPFAGRQFWANDGGYQTLNFVPSMATMLFGLLAGQMLIGSASNRRKLALLLGSGVALLAVGMAIDTTIWPARPEGWNWTLVPIVKRIWTPSWAVFSTGWALLLLGLFFAVIDVARWRRWAFPLVVVGMNSIAMYVMAQLMKGWVARSLEIHSRSLGQALGYDFWGRAIGDNFYGPFWLSLAVLAMLWLICLWMYRQKIFIRI